MITAAIRNAHQSGVIHRTSTAVTSTVAEISPITLIRTSTDMYRDISVSTACSGAAPSPGERPSSLAPARDTRSRAASALTHQPASATSASAATSSQPIGVSPRPFPRLPVGRARGSGPAIRGRALRDTAIRDTAIRDGAVALARPPAAEQLVLQAEHLRVLLGLGVVVA